MSDAVASGPSPGACTLQHRDGPMFDFGALLAGCNTVEIWLKMNEFERAQKGVDHLFSTWPLTVKQSLAGEFAKWRAENPARIIRMTSYSLHQGIARMIVHHGAPQ